MTGVADDDSSPPSLIAELASQLEATRRLLAADPDAAAELALRSGAAGAALETRVAASLAAPPLADPAGFPAAHRLTIRALEVLDREGPARVPVGRHYSILRAPASFLATFVAASIARSYIRAVAARLAVLYARREAQCEPGTPARSALAGARAEMQRLLPGFSGRGAALPALVIGGAGVPVVASFGQYLVAINRLPAPVLALLFAALVALFVAATSLVLRGARFAHQRVSVIMGRPLEALWLTIGDAGEPPRDQARLIAAVAIALGAVAWLLVPAAAALVFLAW